MRVLIAEDERRARRRLAELLAELGPRIPGLELVGEAGDGLEALEMIERLRPDVVLLDIRMPKLDGFEVIAELSGPEAPLVIFVMETRKKRVLRGRRLGFDPHPRIPSRERYPPVIIQHSSADWQQQMSPALTLPHLLLLDHPPGNHLVDR